MLVTGLCHLLATIAFSTANFLFALFALRDKCHLFAVGLGDALGNDTLVKAAKQLFNALTITAFDFHARRSPPSRKLQVNNTSFSIRCCATYCKPVTAQHSLWLGSLLWRGTNALPPSAVLTLDALTTLSLATLELTGRA